MYRRYAVLVIGVCAILGNTSFLFADPRSLFEEAERRFENGAYELAIDRFRTLRQEYPNSEFVASSNLRIGQSNFYLGQYREAQDELSRVRVRAQRGSALQQEAVFWSGLTAYHLSAYPQTIEQLSRYLDLEGPQRARALLYRGVSYLEVGDVQEGQRDLVTARGELDGSERGYAVARLLQTYQTRGEDHEIIDLFLEETSSGTIPTQYQESVYRIAADAMFRMNDTDRAVAAYERLSEFSVASAQWAFQRLYQLAQRSDDQQRMDEIFRRAEERLSAEPERLRSFWLNLGSEAVEGQRYELAELYLSRLWRLRESRPIPAATALLYAKALNGQSRDAEAIEILEDSFESNVEEDGTRTDRALLLGRLYFSSERYEDAVDTVESIERFDTDSRSLYLWSASMYRSGRYEAMVQRLEQPASQPIGREIPEIYRLRGRGLLEIDRPEDAVAVYRIYLAERPQNDTVRLELARALVSAGEFSAALQELARLDATEFDSSGRSEIAYLRGLSLFHRREYETALSSFAAVEENTYEPLLSYHVAWSLYRTGKIAEAGRRIAAVRDVVPIELSVDAAYLHGWTLYQRGRYQETVDELLPQIGNAPTREQLVELRRLIAAAYLSIGADTDALRQYRAILDEAGTEERPFQWDQYAGVLASIGRGGEAVAEYDEIARRYPDRSVGEEALLEAGQILVTEEDYTAARERFRTYRNRYPEGSSIDRALYWGGFASVELDEAERALLWWDPLVREFPRSSYTPRALFQSAVIHADRNRWREALELFDRYVAAYPDGSDRAEAERRRQELRLEQSGLTATEARLWAELEPNSAEPPTEGSAEWFELVLELGQIAIREQITLTFERGRIVPKLLEAIDYSGDNGARAHILLAEYYQRRGETRRALEQYIGAAATDGAADELRAQSLYRLAELAHIEGDDATAEDAARELRDRYPDTIWADQAERMIGGER